MYLTSQYGCVGVLIKVTKLKILHFYNLQLKHVVLLLLFVFFNNVTVRECTRILVCLYCNVTVHMAINSILVVYSCMYCFK